MARFRILPHNIASAESVAVKHWWYYLDKDSIRELPEAVEGWDYSSTLVVGVDLDIDRDELSASTGLPLGSIVGVAALDCPMVGERFTKQYPVIDGLQSLSIALPRGRAAGEVVASVHLVAAQEASRSPGRSRTRAAARLFDSDPRRIRLEGSRGRFPVEVCKFSSIGYQGAPWTLVTDFDDLNDAFLGSVRLFVNTEHPLGASASNPSADSSAALMLKIDTMRLLISEIARNEWMCDARDVWSEGGVADVVHSMCTSYFNRGLDTMISLLKSEPAEFERCLYDSITFKNVESL